MLCVLEKGKIDEHTKIGCGSIHRSTLLPVQLQDAVLSTSELSLSTRQCLVVVVQLIEFNRRSFVEEPADCFSVHYFHLGRLISVACKVELSH